MNTKINKSNESHAVKMLNHLKRASEILKEAVDKLKEMKK